MLTVGIDVGGTFTDFVFLDRVTKAVSWRKVPTTPDDPTPAVLAGLADAVPRIERIVHGTTIGTNAILQRKGSTVALITTQGIRDQIEIGDTLRYTGGLYIPEARGAIEGMGASQSCIVEPQKPPWSSRKVYSQYFGGRDHMAADAMDARQCKTYFRRTSRDPSY